jgi:glutamate N-acetyltransferase/amino-acid N-acetyltransferase
MATMLCVVSTDAPVAGPVLSGMLRSAVDGSFNRISVDGCMSTNDAVIVLATGTAEHPPGLSGPGLSGPGLSAFERGLRSVLGRLAEMVVRDGEGASRVARIRVSGARSVDDAVGVGRQVADSALVRTALAGGDPNWGRILAAMGAGPVRFAPEKVSVTMGPPDGPGVVVCRFGVAASFDRGEASTAVSGQEVAIGIDLGAGEAAAEVLACDLTHDYITINAEYTT